MAATHDPPPAGFALLTGPEAAEVLTVALSAAGAGLVAWRRHQVTHRPGGDVTVSYRARVREPDGTEQDATLVASTARAPEGALVLDGGGVRVAVWRFPHDPLLPGLAPAYDREAVAEVLGRLGLAATRVRLRTRAYRPGRRAVVEAAAGGARLFLKVVRPDEAEGLHRRHRLLVGSGVPAPRSLGWSAEGIVVLEALPGRSLRQTLRSSTAPVPLGPGRPRHARPATRRAGRGSAPPLVDRQGRPLRRGHRSGASGRGGAGGRPGRDRSRRSVPR